MVYSRFIHVAAIDRAQSSHCVGTSIVSAAIPCNKINRKVFTMLKNAVLLALAAPVLSVIGFAQGNTVPVGVPSLDHVFLIMMENHGYEQVFSNPDEPYLNKLINSNKVNLATNYFAVGHPSLTNYLEIVGGSNFGIRSDNSPNWGSISCTPNIVAKTINADDAGGTKAPGVPSNLDKSSSVCPVSGSGTDAATPAVDTWNEVSSPDSMGVIEPFAALADIDGIKSVAAAPTVGMTIADQLTAVGLQWKTYQESLPLIGAYKINYSNGTATNLSSPLALSDVVQDYAVKHNPFAYFKSIQEGTPDSNSLANVVGFGDLWADLTTGDLPAFSFIVPNQCNDQHGRGNADAFCAFDPGGAGGVTYGTQKGLNPGLILQGDNTIQRIVEKIQSSPAWQWGRNAIIIVWDENDYSGIATIPTSPAKFPSANQNRVVLTVQTNYQGKNVGTSGKYYNSYSILKSLEGAFGLPCLNHACDKDVSVMSDLFALPPQQ